MNAITAPLQTAPRRATPARWALLALVGFGLAAIAPAPASAGHHGRKCTALYVPVPTAEVPDGVLYGELCRPANGPWPDRVQLLVHGTGHNHRLWDLTRRGDHSHVNKALAAGWATFNIDKIGTGRSTIPADSTVLTVASTIATLHQVAAALRDGTLCGHACNARPFDTVVYVGHSLSTAIGWEHGRVHPDDFDAFILEGLVHATTPAFLDLAFELYVPASGERRRWRDLDEGYVTSEAWTRDQFLINADNTDRVAVVLDERHRDIAAWAMTLETASRFAFAPTPCATPGSDTPSCFMTKPVYLLLGELDQPSCGGGGPLPVCTDASVEAFERDFYAPEADLKVYVVPNAGHAIQIEYGYDDAYDWLTAVMTADGF